MINPRAFGPLPASQLQANTLLAEGAPAGPSLTRLTGLTGPPEPQGPAQMATPTATDEGFQPVMPEQFTGLPGANVADLPGAQTGTDFTSPEATQASGLGRLLDFKKSTAPLGQGRNEKVDLGSIQPPDWAKAVSAVNQGLRLGKSGVQLAQYLTSGTEGGSSALGAAGGAAGAATALLGLLASATGDPELKKAAQAAGAAVGVGSLAATGANLAATGGTLAAAGASAGIGAAAGAALAPVTAALLIDSILQLAGSEDAPNLIGSMMEGTVGHYPFFGTKLANTLSAEKTNLSALSGALPYVQSQQQLADLLSQYKQRVGQNVGGYGEGSDPYAIPDLPGAGGSAHEGGINADFSPQVTSLNQLIGQLKGGLPATGGGDAAQLWNQLFTQSIAPSEAPLQVTLPGGGVQYMMPSEYATSYNQMIQPQLQAGMWTPGYLSNAIPYGQPGYNYENAGLLAPGAAPGAPSAAWTTLMGSLKKLAGG